MRLRAFPDPHKYFEQQAMRAVVKSIRGLKQAGLHPDDALTETIIEQAALETKAQFDYEATRAHLEHLQVMNNTHHKRMNQLKKEHEARVRSILKEHRRRMNKIKRESARQRLVYCPLLALSSRAWPGTTGVRQTPSWLCATPLARSRFLPR